MRNIKREAVKTVLRLLLKWKAMLNPMEGYSIILGVPWALRHLLRVNLLFVEKLDLTQLVDVHIVFDRIQQPEGHEFCTQCKNEFSNLPLKFHFHPEWAGKIVNKVKQSKFYASLNWVTGIKYCRTKYAILHDFDLYPVNDDYFESNYRALKKNKWKFSGHEYTFFDGLTDNDGLIGTWSLGIDVEWLRANYSPVDCFHIFKKVNRRLIDLDAFTYIESITEEKGLADKFKHRKDFAHVMNLCSTYLRFSQGLKPNVVWRLHYLWYLEDLAGHAEKLNQVIKAMQSCKASILNLDDYTVDFTDVDVTCANVLRKEIFIMDKFIYGEVRPVVIEYVDCFEQFLLCIAGL